MLGPTRDNVAKNMKKRRKAAETSGHERERQRGRERRQQRRGSSGLDALTGYANAAGFHHFCPETLQFPSLPWGADVSPLPGLGLGQGTDSGHGMVAHTRPREGSECPYRHQENLPWEKPRDPALHKTPAPPLRLPEHTVRSAQLVQPRSDARAKSLLASTGHCHLCGCLFHRNGPVSQEITPCFSSPNVCLFLCF